MCLVAIGCGPVAQPVWNKDSRSFFYAHADGSVAQYDLDKKAARTLLAAGQQQVKLVALSPARSALALAPAALGEQSRALQVGLLELPNGTLSWSKLEVWGDPRAKRVLAASSCFWCPTGRRILVWYHAPTDFGLAQSTPAGKFAVFDVQSKTLTELTTAPPAVILAQLIHASPLCPDGSGYVAMKWLDKGPKFFFVSWDGWEYPLVSSEKVDTLLSLEKDPKAPGGKKMETYFPLPQGVWADSVLKFTTRHGTIAMDMKQRAITLMPLTAMQQRELDQIVAADISEAPWATLQTAPFQGGEFALHVRMKMGEASPSARIELVDSKAQRRRVLLEGQVLNYFLNHHLFPSPDGQLILACLRQERTKNDWIHIVQPDGTILANIDIGTESQPRAVR